MISVGIHDNVRVHKATKNDKGSLVIGYKQESGKVESLMDILNGASDATGGGKDQDFLIYGPKATNMDNVLDTPANNIKKVQELKVMLNHILLNYMTSDKIAWDIMRGCNVTNENINDKFVDQNILDRVYANIVDQFIAMMSPFLGKTDKLFRALFVRQSKTKHFPALRKRFLDEQPFMESMEIPKEQSKLKFTKWEIGNGYNSGEKVTGAETPSALEASAVASVFGS